MAGEGVSFRSFVSETELDEKRKQRQEEWEKVRTAEQPLECPEDEVDPRSLFEKLQQQKDKKQSDYDEQFKFKNMVRGIDEDESKFLDEVADRQMEMETKRHREEKDMLEEMKEYTERVVLVDESKVKPTNKTQPSEKMTSTKTTSVSSTRRSQASLLAGAVKRKRNESDDKNGEKKSKPSISALDSQTSTSRNGSDSSHDMSNESQAISSTHTTISETTERTLVDDKDRAQVVSILPGLGFYSNSSDSDTSSSDSEVDLLNSVIRRPTKKKGNASCN